MKRLAAVDWLLIGTLLPICIVSIVLSVVHGVRGDFRWVPLALSSAADGESYPIVRWVLPSWSAAGDSLVVGDRVLRLEDGDLRGLSVGGFVRRACAADPTAGSLLFTVERSGARSAVRVPLMPGWDECLGCSWWAPLPLVLSFAGTALLLLVRAVHWHLARRVYVAFLLSAIGLTPYFQLSVATPPWLWFIVWVLFGPMIFGITLWGAFEFAPGSRLSGFWQRALPWAPTLLVSASAVAELWLPDKGPAAILMRSFGVAATGYAIALLVAVTRGYQRADPLGRRQLKWIAYGFYVAVVPFALYTAVSSMGVWTEWVGALFVVQAIAHVAIPLGFVVAIAFYQFLDIDSLFSATLSYSVLAFLGIAGVFGVMPTASLLVSSALGLTPAIGQILVSLGLAGVIVPAYRIVRPSIDRLLFPERASLEQGFEELLDKITSCSDIPELTQVVGERLDALLRPASAVLYAGNGDAFTPLTVRGRAAPPAFAARSALIALLHERTTPLAAEHWTARRTTLHTPFERAAIETLAVAVLVPIRRGPDLVAFLCLGPKRSGDIYTTTDLAFLGAIAGKISDRLLTLDATRIGEQVRAPRDLAQYEYDRMWAGGDDADCERTQAPAGQEALVAAPEIDMPQLTEPAAAMRNGVQSIADCRQESPAAQEFPIAAAHPALRLAQSAMAAVFRREGDYWTIAFDGTPVRLKDNKGLQYLSHLLRHPDQEFLALDLVTGGGDPAGGVDNDKPVARAEGLVTLDAQAKAEYRHRLAELRANLEEAEGFNDLGQADKAREEIELVTNQLAAAVGLGGRDRTAASSAERARATVTQRIKAAIRRIAALSPGLADHLASRVKTGRFCVYRPDPARPIRWTLE